MLLALFAHVGLASPLFPYEPAQRSDNKAPAINKKVGFDQKLDGQVPMDLKFRDESGKTVALGDVIQGPTILTLVYYGCPNLCTLVINGLFKGMQELPFKVGQTYSAVFVSINPKETSTLAAQKRASYLKRFREFGTGRGIHFLTGDEPQIEALAKAIGYRYTYDAKVKQYAHPAGTTVLTSQGKISKYLFGIDFLGKDLKYALIEASKDKIGSPIDKFVLYCCYQYDPVTGRYSFLILKVLRIFGILTILCLGGGVLFLLRHEKKQAGVRAS